MAEEPPPAEPAAAPAVPPTQAAASKTRDPNRPLTFRYWSRPTYLQYKMLYDYRHNYYDDVIDYLDRRSRGYSRDIPRPQEWAERALRTRLSSSSESQNRMKKDIELLSNIRTSAYSYQYHKWDYLVRRYPALTL
ncbi:flightin [Anabrus simplex]|uniref:flightin n=1 Tax=Anabrus simplex TaxID=316456 RepID=UPI0034DD8A88